MKLKTNKKENITYAVFDNFFNEEEEKLIWKDLEFLNVDHLMGPKETSSAYFLNDGGVEQYLKRNRGMWLDDMYDQGFFNKRVLCNYFNLYQNWINEKIAKKLVTADPYFRFVLQTSNINNTLLSYYDNGDFYLPHGDISVYTFLYYTCKDEKVLEGGDLRLTELDVTIPFKNNRAVLIPSFIEHEVTPLTVKTDKKGFGRYCFSTFYGIKL